MKLTQEEALEEIVAESVPVALSDKEAMKTFVRDNRTVAEKIRDFFVEFAKTIEELAEKYFWKTERKEVAAMLLADTQELKQIAEALDYALSVVAEENAQVVVAENATVDWADAQFSVGNEPVFSLRTLDDGTRYTIVDADALQLDGFSDADNIGRRARLYMREHYRGVVLPVGQSKSAYVRSEAINEYTNPAKMLDTETYSAKMKAATELENLLQGSEFLRWNPDDGRHKDAVRGWNTWRTLFAVRDGSEVYVYEGETKIKRIARGDVFYDITGIKNITDGNMGQRISAEAQSIGDNISISEDQGNVNAVGENSQGKRVALQLM